MAVQRQGNVKGRAPSGHANQHAELGCKEPITLILGQAPSTTSLVLWYNYSHNNFSRILPESH